MEARRQRRVAECDLWKRKYGGEDDKAWDHAIETYVRNGKDNLRGILEKYVNMRHMNGLPPKLRDLVWSHYGPSPPEPSVQLDLERRVRINRQLLARSVFLDKTCRCVGLDDYREAYEREVVLTRALSAVGCAPRTDSNLCCKYVFGGVGDPDAIALVMEEMKWLYENTDYRERLSHVRSVGRRRRMSEAIKDQMAAELVTEEVPTLMARRRSRLHSSLLDEPPNVT
jgi:hypothetical protein